MHCHWLFNYVDSQEDKHTFPQHRARIRLLSCVSKSATTACYQRPFFNQDCRTRLHRTKMWVVQVAFLLEIRMPWCFSLLSWSTLESLTEFCDLSFFTVLSWNYITTYDSNALCRSMYGQGRHSKCIDQWQETYTKNPMRIGNITLARRSWSFKHSQS